MNKALHLKNLDDIKGKKELSGGWMTEEEIYIIPEMFEYFGKFLMCEPCDDISYTVDGYRMAKSWFVEPGFKVESIVHPEHYNQGIECWDYIVSHNLGFLAGNIIKYVTRAEHKNGVEDLYKARQYLDKLLEVHESETTS